MAAVCRRAAASVGSTLLIVSPLQTAARVETLMIAVLPQTEHLHRNANGETAAAQSQFESGCFMVVPSLWALDWTLIALDRRGLPKPRSFHSKSIAQRGRRARSLQGEYSRGMLWHKVRRRSHLTVCEKERIMQGCDRLCCGPSAASTSQLPDRFFDRTSKNLSTKRCA